MPASKLNFVVIYKHDSQVYGTATRKIALESPPPPDVPLEDKMVGFITWHPDEERLMFHLLPQEEVLEADIKWPKPKETNVEEEDDSPPE